MKVLITGITGFVGSHLAELMLSFGHDVYGTVRWRSRMDNIAHLTGKVKLLECDMKDAASVEMALRYAAPDRIYHLAAQSFVPASWNSPAETMTNNVTGQINLFEAVRRLGTLGIKPRIQIACSSEEYGMVYPDEVPITEENPLRPLSPYGVSKVAQDMLGYQYWQSYGLHVVRTRAFNHTGARRGDVFVESNFARQIARIEREKQEPVIYVGNLKAKRDYTDVRDMVKAYYFATENAEAGEVYNICSGEAWSIQQILEMLLFYTDRKVEIKEDASRMRPSDVMVLKGCAYKFSTKTGWNPEIKITQTLHDLLNYWRERESD